EETAADGFRPALEVEEPGDRGTVDVGVEDADAEAVRLQREREVDGGGRLADAALAARHGDDRVNAGDAGLAGSALRRGSVAVGVLSGTLLRRRGGARTCGGAALLLGGQHHHRALDARHR